MSVTTATSAGMPLVARLARILAAFWAGSLWTACALVAPTLFATLPTRPAGQVATRLFHIEANLGAVCALALLAAWASRRLPPSRPLPWLIGLTGVAPLLSDVGLGPLMAEARATGEWARFEMLHGVSAVLFATACVSALAMLWVLSGPGASRDRMAASVRR